MAKAQAPYIEMSKERTLEFWWCHLEHLSPAIATPLRKCTLKNEEMGPRRSMELIFRPFIYALD